MDMNLYHIQGWFGVYHKDFESAPFVHWNNENIDFLLEEDPL